MAKRVELARKFTDKKFVYINQVLAHDELIFEGRSFVVEPSGEISLILKSFEEDEALIDFETPDKFSPVSIFENEEEIVYRAMVFGLREYLLQIILKE